MLALFMTVDLGCLGDVQRIVSERERRSAKNQKPG